jgi:c-di-GMP-binding flagellar brake protein YcgR
VYSQRILAVGRILRVDGEDEGEEDGPGVAVEFSSISNRHEDAITRYALMRERQVARSEHLDVFDD